MEFKTELENYQKIINKELEKYLRKEECPERILNESMEYSLMAGGKRLRPILVLETYKLFKEDYEKVFPYAIAIEMVHNASLIHDDLPGIDNDAIRHNKPTNHKKFNEATAILAGDGLFNYANIVISKDLLNTKNDKELKRKIKILNEFSIATDRMLAGEYLDTECEGKDVSSEELEYIHKNKTGAYLKLCARMGAILGGCTDLELQKITTYSEKIGLAFQIKDDILSEIGNEKITGKPVGNDKEKGKCTYISEYGLEESKKILHQITNEAISMLDEFGKKAEFLKELARYIETRNK